MLRQRFRILISALLLAGAFALSGCHSLNDERIPPAPVHLAFTTEANWNLYGVSGAMDWKTFILDKRIPANFPYAATSETGFGGLLLVGSVLGEPVAYDLACPVERSRSVLIGIDTEKMVAECPVCHSTYDVFSLGGHPLSGIAADKGSGLKVYHVGRGRVDYMLVTN